MDNSPASVSTVSPTASPLSPLKRAGSSTIPGVPNKDVHEASRKLRKLMSSDDEGGGSHSGEDVDTEEEVESGKENGKGKRKEHDTDAAADAMRAKLEDQVTCGICQDVFWRPVSLIPCLHTFCGSCLVNWFSKTNTCPSCRAPAKATTDSHASNNLVDMFLSLPRPKGEQIDGRTKEEKDELDKLYKPGMKLNIRRDGGDFDEEDFDDEEGFDEEVDEDQEDFDDFNFVPRGPRFHQPCPCCDPLNVLGYSCPVPVVVDEIKYTHFAAGHKQCIECENLVPDAGAKYLRECTVCKIVTCTDGFGCEGRGRNNIRRFSDQQPVLPFPQVTQTFPSLFNSLASEQIILQSFLIARNWSLGDLWHEMFVRQNLDGCWPVWLKEAKEGDEDEDEKVGPDDLVCSKCSLAVMEATLEVKWKRLMKEEASIKDYIAPHVINRQDCWYGLTCRTAVHNIPHANRLSHLCPTTRPAPLPLVPNPMPLSGVRARINIGDVLPPFDPTSKTTIQIRDLNGARVFPVSAHVNENGGRSLPGKFVCNRGGIGGLFMSSWGLDRDETAEIRANGGESELLIDMRGMQWVKSTDRGEKPDGVRAVVGGTGAAGEEIFHAIGWRDGVRVPGWTKEGMGGALIGYANKGWFVREFDLLCFE